MAALQGSSRIIEIAPGALEHGLNLYPHPDGQSVSASTQTSKRSFKNALLPLALPALALLILTPANAQTPATVVEVVTSNEDLSTLASALETAGLTEALSGEGPYTVFAPTNEAFAELPAGELERLLAAPDELERLLSYHVVADRLLEQNFGEIVDDSAAPLAPETLAGSTLSIDVEEDTDPAVVINNVAGVTEADVTADNGVVHIIDAVLMPGVTSDGAPDTMSGSGASGGGN